MSDNLLGKAVDQAGGVLEKAYDDLAHPTAKSLGNTVSLLPRTVGVWLGKWEKWVINGEESIRLTAEAVREKAASIPEDKLTEPEPYVAIPAIQQLSYCSDSNELRELYANLLVSSMHLDKKAAVHPAFVDVIKQLTPDEAKLLKYIYNTSSKSIAIIDVIIHVKDKTDGVVTMIKGYSNIYREVLQYPENYAVYVENLIRLNLCEIPGTYLLTKGAYDGILNDPLLPEKGVIDSLASPVPIKNATGTVSREIKKLSLNMTAFGKSFATCCID